MNSNPVPHEVGAQVDAPPIAGAHGHMFAHHGEIIQNNICH
jgi:hypothetical protein